MLLIVGRVLLAQIILPIFASDVATSGEEKDGLSLDGVGPQVIGVLEGQEDKGDLQ